jgi:uncharacterized protein (DUF697 family)
MFSISLFAGKASIKEAVVICVSDPVVAAHIVNGMTFGVGERKCVVFNVLRGGSDARSDENTTSMRSRIWSRSDMKSVSETK